MISKSSSEDEDNKIYQEDRRYQEETGEREKGLGLKEGKQRNRRREELGAAPVAAYQSRCPSQLVLNSCHS